MIKDFETFSSLQESYEHLENYMFFSNLETIKRKIDMILSGDFKKVDKTLCEHNWALDHVSAAKENIDQVCDFLAGKKSPEETPDEEHEEHNEEE